MLPVRYFTTSKLEPPPIRNDKVEVKAVARTGYVIAALVEPVVAMWGQALEKGSCCELGVNLRWSDYAGQFRALRGYPNRGLASPKKTIVPRDSGAGKLKHGQVVFRLFGPANEQVAKPVEPGMGALHDPTGAAPAAGFLARFFGLGFFAARPDVGRVAERRHHFPHLRVVVARVQAQALPGTAGQMGLPGGFSGGWQAG